MKHKTHNKCYSDILTLFGNQVKLLRKRNNWTQSELANRTGLHINYIGMIERGERNPSLKNIELIADAFEISISELLDFERFSI